MSAVKTPLRRQKAVHPGYRTGSSMRTTQENVCAVPACRKPEVEAIGALLGKAVQRMFSEGRVNWDGGILNCIYNLLPLG